MEARFKMPAGPTYFGVRVPAVIASAKAERSRTVRSYCRLDTPYRQ